MHDEKMAKEQTEAELLEHELEVCLSQSQHAAAHAAAHNRQAAQALLRPPFRANGWARRRSAGERGHHAEVGDCRRDFGARLYFHPRLYA